MTKTTESHPNYIMKINSLESLLASGMSLTKLPTSSIIIKKIKTKVAYNISSSHMVMCFDGKKYDIVESFEDEGKCYWVTRNGWIAVGTKQVTNKPLSVSALF